MAALPQNNTDRYFMDYSTGAHAGAVEHTMAVRVAEGVTDAQANAFFLDMLTVITAPKLWSGWKPLRLRFQAAGTDFSIPVDMEPALETFAGSASATSWNDMSEAIEFTVQGRSYTTGRRVDFSLYGLAFPSITKPRYLPGDAQFPWLSGFLNGLNAETSIVRTIDGSRPTWYRYLNANYNSYWEARARR